MLMPLIREGYREILLGVATIVGEYDCTTVKIPVEMQSSCIAVVPTRNCNYLGQNSTTSFLVQSNSIRTHLGENSVRAQLE